MSDDLDNTVRIQRHSRVGTASRGRTAWTKPVEPVELADCEELALVTAQVLRRMFAAESGPGSDNDEERADEPGDYNPYDHT